MNFIRTVLGDVAPESLGICYAHEHLIIDPCFATHQNPEFLLNEVDLCAAELREFARAGGGALVDSMPCDCGRNVTKLAEVSRRTGLNLLAPTGLHLAKYYDPGHWGNSYSEEELFSLFLADIEQGIDERDYNGPLVKRTPHRAGLIKVATDLGFTPREQRSFRAAAAAHRRTGCPILTHTEQGELAVEQLELFRDLGVDLRHVCLSHTDRKPDLVYHREILSTGVKIEFDGACRAKPGQRNATADLLLSLLPEFPHQLMLGMDAAKRSYWRSYGGKPGLAFLLESFCPLLRDLGVSGEQLRAIFVDTPAATYAFAAPKP